jgi:hypothetical protein
MPRPPASSTSAAVSSIVSGRSISDRSVRVVRPVTYTVAPAEPSCTAIPRPAARVAPATRATLPSSDVLMDGGASAPTPQLGGLGVGAASRPLRGSYTPGGFGKRWRIVYW